MEIKITTSHILKLMQVLSWIIFIGLCIQAGAIIVSTFAHLFFAGAASKSNWAYENYLSQLLAESKSHFITVSVLMVIVAVLKAIMFYLIVKIFHEKKQKLSAPFNEGLVRFILNSSLLALGIGLFSAWGERYCEKLTHQGFPAPDLSTLHMEGASVWLFMAAILFLIVQVVKRGVELQAENDLTI